MRRELETMEAAILVPRSKDHLSAVQIMEQHVTPLRWGFKSSIAFDVGQHRGFEGVEMS